MIRTTIIIAAVAVTGCAAPVYRDASGTQAPQRVLLECYYEGEKATASQSDILTAGWMSAQLRDQCLALKGYRR